MHPLALGWRHAREISDGAENAPPDCMALDIAVVEQLIRALCPHIPGVRAVALQQEIGRAPDIRVIDIRGRYRSAMTPASGLHDSLTIAASRWSAETHKPRELTGKEGWPE